MEERIKAYFKDKERAMVSFLTQLCELESPTTEKEAVDILSRFIAERFKELGAQVEVIPQKEVGDCLRVEYGEGEEQVLLLCHMDTVWSLGEVKKRPITEKDGKLFGPGTLDMKSGIVIAYYALSALKELSLKPKSRVVILLNSDEEIGSPRYRQLIEEEARRSRVVYCLEPSLPGGALKTVRKGVGKVKLRVFGKAVHAGANHKEGISAIEELAHQIIYIHSLTDYSREITLNVGRIEGGTRPNVVAAEAEAEIDLRFLSPEDGEEMMNKLLSLKPKLPGAKLEITGRIASPPLVKTKENAALFEKVKEVGKRLGIALTDGMSGGGSDASFASAVGTPTIDGLGADGEGLHAIGEHVIIRSLPERGMLLTAILTLI